MRGRMWWSCSRKDWVTCLCWGRELASPAVMLQLTDPPVGACSLMLHKSRLKISKRIDKVSEVMLLKTNVYFLYCRRSRPWIFILISAVNNNHGGQKYLKSYQFHFLNNWLIYSSSSSPAGWGWARCTVEVSSPEDPLINNRVAFECRQHLRWRSNPVALMLAYPATTSRGTRRSVSQYVKTFPLLL